MPSEVKLPLASWAMLAGQLETAMARFEALPGRNKQSRKAIITPPFATYRTTFTIGLKTPAESFSNGLLFLAKNNVSMKLAQLPNEFNINKDFGPV